MKLLKRLGKNRVRSKATPVADKMLARPYQNLPTVLAARVVSHRIDVTTTTLWWKRKMPPIYRSVVTLYHEEAGPMSFASRVVAESDGAALEETLKDVASKLVSDVIHHNLSV